MSLRDDVVLRVIHQLVEALLRAAGLRKKKDLPAAEQSLGEGLAGIGLSLELLMRLDAGTLRAMLPDPTRRVLVALSLGELSLVREADGRVDDALHLEALAHALVDDLPPAEVEDLPPEVRSALDAGGRFGKMSW